MNTFIRVAGYGGYISVRKEKGGYTIVIEVPFCTKECAESALKEIAKKLHDYYR